MFGLKASGFRTKESCILMNHWTCKSRFEILLSSAGLLRKTGQILT